MSTVAIYFTDPGFEDYPFNEEEYREAYHIFARLLEERGIHTVLVRAQRTYRGGTTFDGGWEYRDEAFHRVDGAVTADLIFNRGKLDPDPGAAIINDVALNRFCDDKAATYERFADISPVSITVDDHAQLEQALARIPSDLIVSKPIDGLGGAGIVIGSRKEILASAKTFPCIVQEFIDTSDGIPGICEGMHDFRMVSIRGEIVAVFIRAPREGSYLANVAQGGSVFELPVERIPPEARAIFAAVDRAMAVYPRRVYCVDVARGKDGRWILIELNAQPGLSSYDYEGRNDPAGKGEGSKRYLHGLVDLLAESV